MDNQLQILTKGFFARHETFCPRYGWLKKGFDRVNGFNGFEKDANIFDADDAIEKLGVGKNMVRAIRFWCMAFKVIEPYAESDKTGPVRISGPMQATDFGRELLSEDGRDPFLEDTASLWLLHWKLFTPPYLAAAWSMAVNLSGLTSFSSQDLSLALTEQKKNMPEFQKYSDSSFQKDASCFIRMYSPGTRQSAEETECPFTQLEFLISDQEHQKYCFNPEDKAGLPDDIFLSACFEYAHIIQPDLKTLSLHRLAYGFNSPGMVFRLSESDMGNRLEQGVSETEGVVFTESYGNRQLQFEEKPDVLARNMLRKYYERN
jgi:hypothetical protein